MRGVALLLLGWLVASCGPDYERTAFRCNATHGCPSGQSCVNERCRRGAPRDAGLQCGDMTCDVTTQQCCVDVPNGARCIKAGDLCSGEGALCGGTANCQDGDSCCADGDTIACFASCEDYACRSDSDCPSQKPNCCGVRPERPGECSQLRCT